MAEIKLEEEVAQIRQIIESTGQAFQNKDPEGFVKPFHEDVITLFPGVTILHGVGELREFIKKAVVDNVSVDYEEIIVRISGSRGCGYAVGVYKAVNETPDGLVGFRSRFLASLSMIDGVWRITAICYNRP